METNKKYIVRGEKSGVFYGEIANRVGQEVTMTNVRQIWSWYGAAALPQLALEGTNRPDDCKFTVTLDELTILDCVEFIPCSEVAVKSLDSVKEWKADQIYN
jgi:hypothetical protein